VRERKRRGRSRRGLGEVQDQRSRVEGDGGRPAAAAIAHA
jgi:hypothetical protein